MRKFVQKLRVKKFIFSSLKITKKKFIRSLQLKKNDNSLMKERNLLRALMERCIRSMNLARKNLKNIGQTRMTKFWICPMLALLFTMKWPTTQEIIFKGKVNTHKLIYLITWIILWKWLSKLTTYWKIGKSG